jgi:hypothetical protein
VGRPSEKGSEKLLSCEVGRMRLGSGEDGSGAV